MSTSKPLTSQDIASLYTSNKAIVESGRNQLNAALKSFVDANENPSTSPNFRSTAIDPIETVFEILQNRHVQKDAVSILLLLKVVKVLSRKEANRKRVGDAGLRAVLLSLAPPLTPLIAAEGANVLLNISYEPDNVLSLLKTPGVRQLISFLSDNNQDLQANAAGAIQSISYQPKGRKHVREINGIPSLLSLLTSTHVKVLTRAVGAIHNLSSDAEAIKIIRKGNGIPSLVQLLSSDVLAISGSAAGALQNVSREVASRLLIRELDAVPPLAGLLSAVDLQAQVCAAGALLNILGPELDSLPDGHVQRRCFGKIMSLIMAGAVVHECVYDKGVPLA